MRRGVEECSAGTDVEAGQRTIDIGIGIGIGIVVNEELAVQ